MKNFIAGVAVLLVILLFPLQIAMDVINDQRLNKFDVITFKAIQIARTDGYFKQSTIENLKSELLTEFPDLEESDIVINVTTTPKYRTNEFDDREVISYDIAIPVSNVIVAGSLLGLSDNENSFMSRKKGYVLSEVLMP